MKRELTYLIQFRIFNSTVWWGKASEEIAVIRMLNDNVQYEILKLCTVMDPISNTRQMIPGGTYAGRELLSMLEGIIELNQFEVDDQVTKTNKLKGITEITLNLDELNNSDNLKDGTDYVMKLLSVITTELPNPEYHHQKFQMQSIRSQTYPWNMKSLLNLTSRDLLGPNTSIWPCCMTEFSDIEKL